MKTYYVFRQVESGIVATRRLKELVSIVKSDLRVFDVTIMRIKSTTKLLGLAWLADDDNQLHMFLPKCCLHQF